MNVTPINGNTCNSQLYFAEILLSVCRNSELFIFMVSLIAVSEEIIPGVTGKPLTKGLLNQAVKRVEMDRYTRWWSLSSLRFRNNVPSVERRFPYDW